MQSSMKIQIHGIKETSTESHVGFLHVCVYAHSRHPAI
jgi:hypothetical protein